MARSRNSRPAAVAAASVACAATASARAAGVCTTTSSWRKKTRCGRETRGPVAAQAPEPVAQVGDPAQRPLGAGALHDEVAGEAAVRAPVAGLAVGIGRRVVGVAVPRVAQARRPAPQQRAHHLAPLAGAGRLLDEAEGVGVAAGEPGDHPAALAAGGAVHRAEQAELGVVAAGHRAVVDHPLVEVGAAGRPGQRAVAAHAGEHARLELGDVGDHEHPAVVGHGRGPDLHRERQRASAVGRPPAGGGAGRLVRRPEPAAAHPLVDPGPAVGLEQVRELLVAQQRRRCPGARARAGTTRGCR